MVFKPHPRRSDDEHLHAVLTGARHSDGRCLVCEARGPCYAWCHGDRRRLRPVCSRCGWQGNCQPGCSGDLAGERRPYLRHVGLQEVWRRVEAGLRQRETRCKACGQRACLTECPGDGPKLPAARQGLVAAPYSLACLPLVSSFFVTYRWPETADELLQWVRAAQDQGFATRVYPPAMVAEAYALAQLADQDDAPPPVEGDSK